MWEWPEELRAVLPQLEGYADSLGNTVLAFRMESGVVRQRRKSNAVMDRLTVNYVLTTEQKNVLRDFLQKVAGVSFWMPHPEQTDKEICVRHLPENEDVLAVFRPLGARLWSCTLELAVWKHTIRHLAE